jgi:hypothetical protein
MEHRSHTVWNVATTGKMFLKRSGLSRRWKLFVKQKVDNILWRKISEFADWVSAIMHAFSGCDKRCAAGTNRDSTKTGVQVFFSYVEQAIFV